MSFDPQVMVITGSASGIGRHLSRELLEAGHRLVCTDIDEEGMARWIQAGGYTSEQVVARHLDVRDGDAWRQVIEEAEETMGPVDVVMNVAGYLRPGRVEEVSAAEVDRHLDINTKGVILGTQAAAAVMVPRGRGHIINIGSLASLSPVPGLSLYVASKFAVRGFTLSAAEDLRPRGVAVTLVLLDAVKTPMLDLQADYEEAALTFSWKRPLSVEEVSELFLRQVLPKRPLEVTLPLGRATLARAAGAAPQMSRLLGPLLARKGRRAQERYTEDE